MNNAVYNEGKIVGYRCFICSKVVQNMWGTTCNECRRKEELHRETIKALTGENIQYSPSVTTGGDLPLTATKPQPECTCEIGSTTTCEYHGQGEKEFWEASTSKEDYQKYISFLESELSAAKQRIAQLQDELKHEQLKIEAIQGS